MSTQAAPFTIAGSALRPVAKVAPGAKLGNRLPPRVSSTRSSNNATNNNNNSNGNDGNDGSRSPGEVSSCSSTRSASRSPLIRATAVSSAAGGATASASTTTAPPRRSSSRVANGNAPAPKPSSSAASTSAAAGASKAVTTAAAAAAATTTSTRSPQRQQQQQPAASPLLPHRSTTEPQLCYLGLPIMFTAPHGLEVYRYKTDGKRVIHKREEWTTELVLKLSAEVSRILCNSSSTTLVPAASFCVWNCATAKPFDTRNTDPNYSFAKDFDKLPWNKALRDFKQHCAERCVHDDGAVAAIKAAQNDGDSAAKEEQQEKPAAASPPSTTTTGSSKPPTASFLFPRGVVPLHVDIHGKINRKDNFDLDVGLASFDEWNYRTQGGPEKCNKFASLAAVAFREAMASCPVKLRDEFTAGVEMSPYLHGLWGTDIHATDPSPVTMTTQAVLLGLHSFQLEIPHTMRRALFTSDSFFKAFATAIAKIFVGLQPESVQQKFSPGFFLVSNNNEERALLGHVIVAGMLDDCAKVLRTEKTQI